MLSSYREENNSNLCGEMGYALLEGNAGMGTKDPGAVGCTYILIQ